MSRCLGAFLGLLLAACASRALEPPLDVGGFGGQPLWIAAIHNSTSSELRLPSANPLRSLGEMAGKASPQYRPTVMELLREALRRQAEQRKAPARYPDEYDARLRMFPLGPEAAARSARQAKLQGALLLTEIRRWESEAAGLLRVSVDFKLIRIADGAVVWGRRVQKTVPVTRSGNPAEAHRDALEEIAKELF